MLLSHIAQGLAFLHEHNVVHRDLKPSNVLLHLTSEGRLLDAKIADFGSSKQWYGRQLRTYTGTSVYMAPEFWQQPLSYSEAVDVWSFGILALECLTRWRSLPESWDARAPPTQEKHLNWVEQLKQTHLMDAPERYHLMLRGVLAVPPRERWTAEGTTRWLQEEIASTFQQLPRLNQDAVW